jgi:hypothetical protein
MTPPRTALNLLFRPFTFVAGGLALGVGLVAILLTGFTGWFGGAHFDGVLDVHVGRRGLLWVTLAEGVIDWLCMFVVLLAAGKLISKTAFRAIDLAGTQALARWPMIFAATACLPPGVARFSDLLLQAVLKPKPELPPGQADAFVFFGATLVMLASTVWMVALMYQSFSVSCNVRGAKAIWTFVGALIAAEVLSKIALVQLYHLAAPAARAAGG